MAKKTDKVSVSIKKIPVQPQPNPAVVAEVVTEKSYEAGRAFGEAAKKKRK